MEKIARETKQEDLNNMTDRYIKENAKAIIYFPEGNYILQDEDSKDRRIRISMSDIVLKGAGRNKTTLEMTAANNSPKPTEEMWNAPVMMEFKHNTGLGESIGAITEDAPIGSKTITASLTGVSAGSWVCLVLREPPSWETRIMMLLIPNYRLINGKILRYNKALLPISKQMVFKYSNTIRLKRLVVTVLPLKNPSCMLLIKIGDGMYINSPIMPMLA
ncbi:hypothetical protein NXW75_21570 [Bacteroides xylanisolvens]|nr:hypothetical protein [Bacteroides xylanisolvens]